MTLTDLRTRLMIARLQRPLVPRDHTARALFATSFATYFVIGQLVHAFGGHQQYNWFFNADVPRVIHDLTQAHELKASVNASGAHPFFVVLLNPLGAVLTRFVCDSPTFAALLLNHLAAALANVLVYKTLVVCGAARPVAVISAVLHGLSTTILVFGSIPETAAFSSLGVSLSIWTCVRGSRVLPAALGSTFTVAINGAMLPHALFAPAALWLRRLPLLALARRLLLLWLVMAVLCAALYFTQRYFYPGLNVLGGSGYTAYDGYFAVPKGWEAFQYRAHRVLVHLIAFAVVAPQPFRTDPPDNITTFMWEQRRAIAEYDLLGSVGLAVWLFLLATACWSNLRHFRRLSREAQGVVVLCLGWLPGVAGLFSVFGDDLLLFSYFWTTHLTVFVGLGVANWVARRSRVPRAGRGSLGWAVAGLLLGALALNQLSFVGQVLGHYTRHLLVL